MHRFMNGKSLDIFLVNLNIAAFKQETSRDTFHRQPGFKIVLSTFFFKGCGFIHEIILQTAYNTRFFKILITVIIILL